MRERERFKINKLKDDFDDAILKGMLERNTNNEQVQKRLEQQRELNEALVN